MTNKTIKKCCSSLIITREMTVRYYLIPVRLASVSASESGRHLPWGDAGTIRGGDGNSSAVSGCFSLKGSRFTMGLMRDHFS